MFDFQNLPFVLMYEGEGEPSEDGAAAAAAAADKGGAPKDFSEEQQAIFNKAQADLKRGFQKQIDTLQTKLASTPNSAKITEELENVRASLRTTEEQAAHRQKQLEGKHAKELESATTQAKTWQKRYADMHIQNDLLSAANANKAYNPQQIVQILSTNTRLVESTGEDGKPNGIFKSMTKIALPNDKGEMVELDLAPVDAVKRMSDASDLYGNLFKIEGSGGHGGDPNRKGGKEPSLASLVNDPEAYRAKRKEMKNGK